MKQVFRTALRCQQVTQCVTVCGSTCVCVCYWCVQWHFPLSLHSGQGTLFLISMYQAVFNQVRILVMHWHFLFGYLCSIYFPLLFSQQGHLVFLSPCYSPCKNPLPSPEDLSPAWISGCILPCLVCLKQGGRMICCLVFVARTGIIWPYPNSGDAGLVFCRSVCNCKVCSMCQWDSRNMSH